MRGRRGPHPPWRAVPLPKAAGACQSQEMGASQPHGQFSNS